MSSDPMMAPTSSAPSTPSPPPVALHLHASSWRSWGAKEAGKSGGEGGANSATDSSQSSVVPSSVSVIAAVLATLTVATVSVAYKSFQLRRRSSRMQRSQSTAPDRPRTRHVEASNSLYTSDITMDTIRAATPLSRSTPRSNSTTDCCSTSGGGCNSTAAHVAAGANPSSTAALDSGLAEDSDFEEGVVGKPLPLAPLMDTTADAGARSDNRDMRLPQSSAPPLQMAHSSRTRLHDRRATPASSAAPLPPPRETPRVLLSNYYDLEPYVLQGLAGGAHGWKRVFGLLKSDMRMGSGRGDACAEDGSASAAGAPGRRAPGSLTRTCAGSNITIGETQALLQERLSPVVPITAAALTKPQTRGASAAASTCHNVAVHSDASVQNSVPEKSVATGKLRTARWCGDDQKLFSLAANFSTPASTPSPPSHPSRPSLSPVAGGPSPPSRFLNSFFFPVLQHLSSCVGRSVGSGLGDSTTTTETTSGTAGSSMHTTSTTNTFVTSAALAVAQRNLQRDISTLVAATASVRLGASASSSFSGSHVHTARCSAVPSVAVSPRVGTTGSCKSQQQHEGVTAAVPCSSFAALYEGSSTGNGGRRKRVAVEGEEGEAQQHQCVCSSRLHQSSDSRCQNSASVQDSDFNVKWYSGGRCGQNIRRSVQERTMLPHTIPCAAAAAAAAAACTTADGGELPVQLEASFTEAATAAGTESTGEPVSPPTVTPRCTIAEQLAVLTSRREQQHRYTQQLQVSRGSAAIGTGVVNTLPSASPTTSPSVHTGAAAAPTAMDFTGAAFSGSTAGAHSSFAWTSQHYTDTAPGVFHPSVLQLRHYENHAYSDITTEVQQCRRRCRRDCVASLGASATAAVRADAEDEDAGHEAHEAHTATLMPREAGITAGLSKRRSVERPAAETGLTGGAQTVAARKVSVAAGATVLASGVCNASPLSHSKPLQPSNERRVDDLTVKHKDDGSASYTISLTYHDSVTGASRTVNTSALPPLRRCDAGAPLPGFSSLSGGTTVRAAARTTRLTTTSTLDSSTSAAASPSHSRSVSGGEAAHACTASSLPARPATAATMGKSLHHSQPQHASDAEENDNASMVLSLSQVARTGDGRPRSAPHSSISVGGSLKCCNSPATVVTAGGTPSGNPGCDTVTATTTISGKINPFAAPLPPVEPQHGPRLRGVEGAAARWRLARFSAVAPAARCTSA
ncbi:protein kinase, putative [Leishmania tarentolae]|uniref:Protein kinase, putative n=1 Tax=Leishmania tarentolae TaxID=5689 RepID=A0A640K951_LEITA|nr:protein kinase, putative [Leishmania tarentolae]